MVRFLAHVAYSIVSSAVALLICSWLLHNFTLNWKGFLLAVIVFTLAQAFLAPFVFKMATQHANGLMGVIGLVSTLVSLFVTSLFPGGLHIRGIGTWVLAALIVWILTTLATWLFPRFFFKEESAAS